MNDDEKLQSLIHHEIYVLFTSFPCCSELVRVSCSEVLNEIETVSTNDEVLTFVLSVFFLLFVNSATYDEDEFVGFQMFKTFWAYQKHLHKCSAKCLEMERI